MRTASVGFQCPTCVDEGAKTTRSGRAPYGGKRSANPALTSQVLIALNVAVFLLIQVTGGSSSVWFYRLALLPWRGVALVDGQPAVFEGVANGAVWQLVTSMFTHVDLWHIGFNMVALWVLGPQLEAVLGRTRFLAVYFLSGLAGSVLVYWLSGISTPTIGASGALFGLMGALLVVVYKVHGDVRQILMWIGLNFVITFLAPFISWQGHLGGFIGGLLIAAAFVYAPKANRLLWQLAAAIALGVLLALAIVARTLVLV
ncbi:MAG TPA: rhomboid family intramembrane serine protease [Nocardioides sp.]|uniref:rhomboid family intramembrane serine protease n=1 Tax=Nocardioides sp. TaxID=35761 RepID=UPI002D7FF0C9|nr:rhomboid family intramembrane serine protease [Nocardioides sp.]HET6652607.1 rhomboid family intramembrane serine protease [Nocardioides sp.]